jgi:hypothetical protein
MSEESLEQIERQVGSMPVVGSPLELRGAVLAKVQRELRASRWDRRLARAAVVLLAIGVGMNVAIGLQSAGSDEGQLARGRRFGARPSLVDTAIVLAEATDAVTAQQFARQMAALAGRKLTEDEVAAIEAAVRRASVHGSTGNKG